MLDIKFIRNNPDIIKEAARKKHISFDVDKLLAADSHRLELLQKVEELRSKQNAVSSEIASLSDPTHKEEKIQAMQDLKALLKNQEAQLKEAEDVWKELMLLVPNAPDPSVPEGDDESGNQPIHKWGDIPPFDFPVRDHVELMTMNKMVDFERGTKVHGFRGYFLQGDGAKLSWALWNYCREFFSDKDFTEFIAPVVVRKQYFYATGHLPNEAEDLFMTQDEDYLSGTAEVPMMAYHADEILDHSELPKRYFAFSPCYRREAGSHGKDTKGIIRVHEFMKLEQLIVCEASHEQSDAFFEEVNRNHELLLESLGLPYRRLLICTGDLSAGKVKQYDSEVWMPSQSTYRETSSASYFHDYQTRRFNIRYRDADGDVKTTHSLNCTAIATPRIMACLVENYQQPDGSIAVPDVLQPYMKKDTIRNS